MSLKILFLLICFYVVKNQVNENHLALVFQKSYRFWWLGVMLIFSLTNWFLDIKKWQLLVSQLRNIDFHEALAQSLSSFVLSLITPNRIGEYGLKVLYYKKNDWKKVVILQSLHGVSQLFATLFFGFFGCLYFSYYAIASALLLVGLLLIYFFNTKKLPSKLLFLLEKIKQLSHQLAIKVVVLSLVKYFVFSFQFLFFMTCLGANADFFALYFGITLMYLFSAIWPTLQLFDVVIKGSVGVVIFKTIGVDANIILETALVMWLFNMLLPAIGGLYYWLKFKTKWQA